MKYGMNMLLWGTHITEEQFHLFKDFKKAGFDGVEVPVFEGDAEHYLKMGQALSDAGLECTVVTCLGADSNPASSDPEIQKAALTTLKWVIEMSAALKAKILVGPYFAAHGHFEIEDSIEQSRKRSASVIKEVAQYAQQFNIQLSLEFLNRFEIFLLNCTEDTANYLDLVNEPNVGILYDTHHANIEEKSILKAFEKHSSKINHIHFSESHRGVCGDGQVKWDENKQAVENSNYDDWIVIEAFAHDIPGFSEIAHVWRPMFETKLQLCQDSLKFCQELMNKKLILA
ncbi:MAG: sugar phosphate isomerase/epimerase [Lentisphaerales bacterium]|nr:sugar phosphate isomerase/epimerase [Lentisphaerales bacterium]